MKLPQEFKEKWVAALRSGEYKQGRLTLYNSTHNTYCCLGVACVVAGISTEAMDFYAYPEGTDVFLPLPNVLKLVDINTPSDLDMLMEMNDNQDKSFDEIAEYIEENL